jgi:5S rRNA maturation endonuclease (ribonuclease M5)
MSSNKHKPHLIVLPEDDANERIVNGFLVRLDSRAIQVLGVAGGWRKVVEEFMNSQVSKLQQYPERRILLLLDFDEDEKRLENVRQYIPNDLVDRVFILGVFSEPENLKSDIRKGFEEIGKTLADDCLNDTNNLWGHELLKHNRTELDRMTVLVKPFLFND